MIKNYPIFLAVLIFSVVSWYLHFTSGIQIGWGMMRFFIPDFLSFFVPVLFVIIAVIINNFPKVQLSKIQVLLIIAVGVCINWLLESDYEHYIDLHNLKNQTNYLHPISKRLGSVSLYFIIYLSILTLISLIIRKRNV